MHLRQPTVTPASTIILIGLCTTISACPSDDTSGEGDEVAETDTDPIFEPSPAECGNGYLELGEDCDDANTLDGDGCDAQCRLPCGLAWETRLAVGVPDVFAEVVDLSIGPSGEMVVAATNDALTSEFSDDMWLGRWSAEGELTYSEFFDLGGDELARASLVDSQGDMYLLGTIPGMDEGTDVWLRRFDPQGGERWTAVYSGELLDSKDEAGGLALGPGGELYVSGHKRVADKDSDAWVARLDPDDGSIVWETFWSGEPAANGYSLDNGGPVVVSADGRIFTMAIEYVDFETLDVQLLELAADGSGVVASWAPQKADNAHTHAPAGLSVAADGSVYFGIARLGAGSTFWVHALDPSGEIQWVREMPSFMDTGEDWSLSDLAVSEVGGPEEGRLLVGGDLVRDEKEGAWAEAFLHRLAPTGESVCTTRYTVPGATLITPNLFIGGVAADAEGNLVAAGRITEAENERFIWLGRFRGP